MSPTISSAREQKRYSERSEFFQRCIYRSDEKQAIVFDQPLLGFGTPKRIDLRANREYLERLLDRLKSSDLPGQEEVAAYLTDKTSLVMHCWPRTSLKK
jgi:hypothetical protein